jgi:hypothetical protein
MMDLNTGTRDYIPNEESNHHNHRYQFIYACIYTHMLVYRNMHIYVCVQTDL